MPGQASTWRSHSWKNTQECKRGSRGCIPEGQGHRGGLLGNKGPGVGEASPCEVLSVWLWKKMGSFRKNLNKWRGKSDFCFSSIVLVSVMEKSTGRTDCVNKGRGRHLRRFIWHPGERHIGYDQYLVTWVTGFEANPVNSGYQMWTETLREDLSITLGFWIWTVKRWEVFTLSSDYCEAWHLPWTLILQRSLFISVDDFHMRLPIWGCFFNNLEAVLKSAALHVCCSFLSILV